jgi:NAD-dependent dihydropyrimidine dehydrogenase PreA subunit
MPVRKIIKIDEGKCDGCGLCVDACHEGALGIADGKARLLRDDYCDGLGDCLPVCPAGAISFEERNVKEYDPAAPSARPAAETASCLRQWPVQIKLAPPSAPYFAGADLLVSADCAAYARADFHSEFMCGKTTLIGCPKLDGVDYSDKLTTIIRENDIRSVTVIRMEVPCCGGIAHSADAALKNSGKTLPLRAVTLSTSGGITEEQTCQT